MAFTEAIPTEMNKVSDTYKDSTNDGQELKEINDKVDCLQRSQVYVHNHITKVENDLNQLKNLILQQLKNVESYDVQIAEVN
ncbi:hypothetical protein BH18THE2_BH18THE2_37440 [soil metagenome]